MVSKRADKIETYRRGWGVWDPELVISSLATGFVFDDPAMPGPVTGETMTAYMASWRDRVCKPA